MEFTVHNKLESSMITLMKIYDSLNVERVCGILTRNSQAYIGGTTIGALAMLSYCNELKVTGLDDKLKIIDINLDRGPVSYSTIAKSSQGLLEVPEGLEDEKFCVVVNPIRFKLVLGRTTYEDSLTSSDLHTYVSKNISDGFTLTEIPMPLLTDKILTFEVERDGDRSTIKSDNISPTILAELGQLFAK